MHNDLLPFFPQETGKTVVNSCARSQVFPLSFGKNFTKYGFTMSRLFFNFFKNSLRSPGIMIDLNPSTHVGLNPRNGYQRQL